MIFLLTIWRVSFVSLIYFFFESLQIPIIYVSVNFILDLLLEERHILVIS